MESPRSSFVLTDTCVLILQRGDLTGAQVDAIVNAANQRMLGGGGVDGAIHRAAGPELLQACQAVPEVRPGVRCPTGEARITAGFRLRAAHVIHTVGPVYKSDEVSAPLLRAAYRNSLRLANAERLRTVAFPAISCGVYAYPLQKAAPLALETCREHAGALREIHFVLFEEAVYEAWHEAASRLLEPAR
jgi:O-acetyl-ADP-ribose deacetylase (regulator of RNase III)